MLIQFKDVLTKNTVTIEADAVRELIINEQGTDYQIHAEIGKKIEIFYVTKEDYFNIIHSILNKTTNINMTIILDNIIKVLNNRIIEKNNIIKEIYKFINPSDKKKQEAFIEEIKVEELNYILGIVEEYRKNVDNR